MESVGRLAGGVAHDFNNLLTVITSYVDVLLRNGDIDDVGRGQLTEVKNAAYRAAKLTQQLLAFSRKQLLRPQELDVNAVIVSMRDMLRALVGPQIEVVTDLQPDAVRVHADTDQVEHAIFNLVANARDAMPLGGTLTLQTRDSELSKDYAAAHPGAQPGRYLRLSIRDTGCGMAEEVLTRLFEPFFTTKEVGKGTGLGLASVFGMVKQSGGHLEVESKVGQGSTFHLYLPEAPAPIQTATDESMQIVS
jgi:signal transduction histidine kinase